MSESQAKVTQLESSMEDSIGARIKQARKSAGMNQAELAARLSVSQPTVANWETGVHDPRQLMLAKIAKVLDVNLAWLSSGERSSVERDKHPAAAYLRRGLHHVPLIPEENILLMLDPQNHDVHEMAIDYIPVTSGNDTLFAFFANDPAMNLSFPRNTLVVVDYSRRSPVDGNNVLLRMEDGTALLRRWRNDPPRLEPYSTDPSHETLYVDELKDVIGIVVVSIRLH
jgi:transcriptional regulator with XRE-family HTH domain